MSRKELSNLIRHQKERFEGSTTHGPIIAVSDTVYHESDLYYRLRWRFVRVPRGNEFEDPGDHAVEMRIPAVLLENVAEDIECTQFPEDEDLPEDMQKETFIDQLRDSSEPTILLKLRLKAFKIMQSFSTQIVFKHDAEEAFAMGLLKMINAVRLDSTI